MGSNTSPFRPEWGRSSADSSRFSGPNRRTRFPKRRRRWSSSPSPKLQSKEPRAMESRSRSAKVAVRAIAVLFLPFALCLSSFGLSLNQDNQDWYIQPQRSQKYAKKDFSLSPSARLRALRGWTNVKWSDLDRFVIASVVG